MSVLLHCWVLNNALVLNHICSSEANALTTTTHGPSGNFQSLQWLPIAFSVWRHLTLLSVYCYYILLTSGIASQRWCHRGSIVRLTSCSWTLCAVFMACSRTRTQDPWTSSPVRWPLHHTALQYCIIHIYRVNGKMSPLRSRWIIL